MERPAAVRRPAEILAVGRLTTAAAPFVANFDTLVVDEETPSKLPKVLLHRLIKLGRAFGFQILTGELLVPDHDMLNLCHALGFSLQTIPEDGLVRLTLDL